MLQAYAEGKDLYSVIAQYIFSNNYEDNREFYPEFAELDLDGEKVIAGTGKEIEYTTDEQNSVILPACYSVQTSVGELSVDKLAVGMLIASGTITQLDRLEGVPKKIRILFNNSTNFIGKSPARITNKAGKERRSAAKTLLLAMTYGMSPATAGKKMGKTAKEGKELFNSFFQKFPKVKQLIEDSKASLRRTGYVEDWAGRRRHLEDYFLDPYSATYSDEDKVESITFNPILDCENRPPMDAKLASWITKAKSVKGNQAFDELAKLAMSQDKIVLTANTGRIAQAERQCLNARIQGGAASLTKLAMVNISNDELLNKYQAKLIITVHDEVLVECPAIYAEEVEKRLPEVMVETAKPYFTVPMSCDPYNVYHWYEETYSASLIAEFNKLKEKLGYDEALNKLYDNHPEFVPERLHQVITTGEDIKFD